MSFEALETSILDMPKLQFPPAMVRRRSPALVYAADDSVPWGALLMLALQHGATAIAFLSYVLVATRAAGLDAAGTQTMLAMTLIGMGVASFLQARGGRWGSGFLLTHVPNPFLISFVSATLVAFGPGGMPLLALVYCAVTLGLAPLITRMRSIFPATVVGTVILVAGMTLVEGAIKHALSVGPDWQISGNSALIALCTLATVVVVSVWGGRRLGLLALMLGMGAGLVMAALLGQLHGLEEVRKAPLLQWPALVFPEFKGDMGMLVAVGLIALLTQLDTMGNITIMDKLEDAEWRRTNMAAVSGGMRAHAVGDMVSGMLGGFPTCTCATNIALAHATHATARIIGVVAALIMAAVAFMPKVIVSLMQIPEPVLGAVELYVSGFLIVAGLELIMSRAMDSRSTFAVGLSVSVGIAVMVMPQLMESVPVYWRSLVGNALVVSGILVILLNLLFRLGTSRKAQLDLQASGASLHTDITNFAEMQGAAWGARRDVVQRAAMAALEAAEGIRAAGRQLQGLRGSFDEFNLDLELLHDGAALPVNTSQTVPPNGLANGAQLDELLDADDAVMEAAMASLSVRLLRHIADKVSAREGTQGQPSVLLLHFAH